MWTEEENIDFYKLDEMEERTERHQQILQQFIAEERKKKGLPDYQEGVESVKPIHEGKKPLMQDSVDHMPIKRRKKWRIW